jgi:tRNA threonylcarbamoyladenosine modification (KEOPS) complex  Pcc1 subunit
MIILEFEARLEFPKEEYRKHIRAISPELTTPLGRSRIDLEEAPDYFYIYIRSTDMVSFKASLNSITRWLNIFERVNDEVN